MEQTVQNAVQAVHDSPTKVVLFVTGGASHISSWLFSVPGASDTVLECRIPYSRSAIFDVLGKEAASKINRFASTSTARLLAQAAYRHAVSLAAPGARVCGIAASCALVSTEPMKGEHRAMVATHSSSRVTEYELTLLKGHRTRYEEEVISSRLVLQAVFDDCASDIVNTSDNVTQLRIAKGNDALTYSRQSSMTLVRELLVSGDHLQGPFVHEHVDPFQALLDGSIKFAEYANNTVNRDTTTASLIFPGSFNPLHHGHQKLMATAKAMYPGDNSAYEISVTNPDKPALKRNDVHRRISQFEPDHAIIITSAPLFSLKAQLFPNCTFVIGMDTAMRIVAPKYYNGEEGMIAALVHLKAQGCKFLVASRLEQRKDGVRSERLQTLNDVSIPTGFSDMFEAIPSDQFRVDISSSEIRSRQNP